MFNHTMVLDSKMQTKTVTILMATYNGASYIKNQILSLQQQKHRNWQLYIQDDGSKDRTVAIIKEMMLFDSRIHLIDNGPSGKGAGKNFISLVKYSNSYYTIFCDQDDIWYEDKLIRAIKTMEEKQIDAYSSNVLAFWEDGKKILINKSQAQKKYDFLFSSAGPGCTYVMKKNFLIDFSQLPYQHLL